MKSRRPGVDCHATLPWGSCNGGGDHITPAFFTNSRKDWEYSCGLPRRCIYGVSKSVNIRPRVRATGVTAEKFEGNVAALNSLVAALGVASPRPKNWTVCHIWSYDDPSFAQQSSVVRLASPVGDRGLPPTWMPNQSGLWRPFEAGRHHKVWRSTRQASADGVPAASEGVQSLRIICAGRSVRNPRGLIRRDRSVQPRGPQPTTGSVIRTGWCRRRAVNAVPAGQEVRFRPLPTMRT